MKWIITLLFSALATAVQGYAQTETAGSTGMQNASMDALAASTEFTFRTEQPQTAVRSLYPNPANTFTNVWLEEISLRPVSVYIINFNGVVVKSQTYDPGGNTLFMDVSNLPRGYYIIQVQEAGKSVQSLKLLKSE